MEGSKGQKYKSRIGVIVTVLLVVLLVYFAAQIFGKYGMSISVMKNQFVTDENYITLHGYVYRNEELILASDGEIADLLVPNGEKIPVGKEYLKLYKTNIQSGSQRAMLQGQLNSLSNRIEALQGSIDEELRIQDIDRINSSVFSSYHAFISSAAKNNYSAAWADGETLLDFMNKQHIITGRLESLNNSAEELASEKNALIEKYATDSGSIKRADTSCYVFRDIDGYEDSFNYADVMTMGVDEFKSSVKTIQRVENDRAVAKRVYDSKWYLVVPITPVNAQNFEVGESYGILLSEVDDASTEMVVERIEMPEGGASGFMVLSSGEIGKSFEVSRYTSIKFLKSSVSGYRIPEDAIRELDYDDDGSPDYTGVYVMSGNYAKFRRIKIISYGVGYVIAKDGDDTEDQFPYLLGNELIIISGGNLYDGKLIK